MAVVEGKDVGPLGREGGRETRELQDRGEARRGVAWRWLAGLWLGAWLVLYASQACMASIAWLAKHQKMVESNQSTLAIPRELLYFPVRWGE